MPDKKNFKEYVEEYANELEPAIKKAKEAVEPQIKKAKEAVEPQIKKAKEAVEPQLKKAKEAVEPQLKKAKDAVEPQLKKAKEAVEPQLKKARKKAEPVVKDAVNRVSKVTTKTDVFIQFDGVELRTEDIVDKVRADYKNKNEDITSLKQLRVYVKPEERVAYYVANQDETGRVDL